MFITLKFSLAIKILLWMAAIGVGLWWAMEWRSRRRFRQHLADQAAMARSAAREMMFTKDPLANAEYRHRRELLSKQ